MVFSTQEKAHFSVFYPTVECKSMRQALLPLELGCAFGSLRTIGSFPLQALWCSVFAKLPLHHPESECTKALCQAL